MSYLGPSLGSLGNFILKSLFNPGNPRENSCEEACQIPESSGSVEARADLAVGCVGYLLHKSLIRLGITQVL